MIKTHNRLENNGKKLLDKLWEPVWFYLSSKCWVNMPSFPEITNTHHGSS